MTFVDVGPKYKLYCLWFLNSWEDFGIHCLPPKKNQAHCNQKQQKRHMQWHTRLKEETYQLPDIIVDDFWFPVYHRKPCWQASQSYPKTQKNAQNNRLTWQVIHVWWNERYRSCFSLRKFHIRIHLSILCWLLTLTLTLKLQTLTVRYVLIVVV